MRLRRRDTSTVSGQSRERYRLASLNAMTGLVARAAAIGAGLITVPLCLAYLGNERYGMWLTLSSLLASLAAVADLGILTSLQLGVSKCDAKGDREGARRWVSSAVAILSATTIIGSLMLIVLVAAINWAAVFNVTSALAVAESDVAVLALGAAWLLNMFSAIVLRVSYGYQDGHITHLFQLLGSVLSVIGVLVLIRLEAGLPVLVTVLGGMMGISLLMQGIHLFGWQRPWLRPARHAVDRAVVKSLLGSGTWHLLASVAYAAFFLSSNIIIAQAMSASVVPEFGVPLRMVTALLMLYGIVATASMPAFANASARGERAWLRRALKRSLIATAAMGVVGAVLLIAVGKQVISLWVGDQVHPSYTMLAGFGAWSVLNGITTGLSSFVLGTGGGRANALQWLTAFLLLIPLQIVALRYLGVAGIPWAMAIADGLGRLLPGVLYYRTWARERDPGG